MARKKHDTQLRAQSRQEGDAHWRECRSVAEALGHAECAAIRRLIEHVRNGGAVDRQNRIIDAYGAVHEDWEYEETEDE